MASPVEQRDATCAGRAGANNPQETHVHSTSRQTTESDDRIRHSEDDRTRDAEARGSAVSSPPPASSPPYWLVHHTHNGADASTELTSEPAGIIMRDNESEDWGGRNSACWARSVEIPDYVVVNGSATNIGAFVVFNVRVETINVGDRCPQIAPPRPAQPRTPANIGYTCAGRNYEHTKAVLRVR